MGILITACGPKYPNCETDEHCKEHNEYCVNGHCVQCRDDNDCPRGQECNTDHRCVPIEGWCESNSDCPEGQVCKNNRCSPCESNSDCGMGYHCEMGKCVEGECGSDADCPAGQQCVNGYCQVPPQEETPQCELESVYFDFDSYAIRPDARETLQSNAECIKQRDDIGIITLEGNCDPRGTTEYNMALGMKRAKAVKKYLMSLGIPGNKMRTISYGEEKAQGYDEATWAKDRRVDFSY